MFLKIYDIVFKKIYSCHTSTRLYQEYGLMKDIIIHKVELTVMVVTGSTAAMVVIYCCCEWCEGLLSCAVHETVGSCGNYTTRNVDTTQLCWRRGRIEMQTQLTTALWRDYSCYSIFFRPPTIFNLLHLYLHSPIDWMWKCSLLTSWLLDICYSVIQDQVGAVFLLVR